MRREKYWILGHQVVFEVPEEILRLELLYSWNHPEEKEPGRVLVVKRKTGRTATVVFFKENRVLRAINTNPFSCEVFLEDRHPSVDTRPFDVPMNAEVQIKGDFPRIILRFRSF